MNASPNPLVNAPGSTPILDDDYFASTQAWESQDAAAPQLRGRRREQGGTALHFLHGNGLSSGVYWPMLRQLSDYSVFCHDYEGHGLSDRPEHFARPAGLIRRIPQIIAEHLPNRRRVGIGHSYGGALTLRVAAAQPQLFSALVLLDPILLPTPAYAMLRLSAMLRLNPMSRSARRRRAHWPSREAAWRHLHQRGIYRGWSEAAFTAFIRHALRERADGSCELSCPPWLEAAIFDHPVYPWQALPRLQCPTLVLYGRSSYAFMAGAMRQVAARNPKVQLEAVDGGHCFMLEDPQHSAKRIAEFLAQQLR